MNAPLPTPPLLWGTAPRLAAFETLMWRLDRYPNLRSSVVAFCVLDQAPDAARFAAAHEWGVCAVPRLHERLVEDDGGLPRWVEDAAFDLSQHVETVKLKRGSALRAAFDFAQDYAMQPFPRERPPWSVRLVTGLKGGQAVYLLKLHHALSDGIGIVQLLSYFLSRQREPSGRPLPVLDVAVPAAAAHRPPRVSPLMRLARRQWQTLMGPGEEPRHSRLARHAASLRRVLAPPPVAPSPLFAARSHEWRFEGYDFPLAALKAAARACNATLNDALVAALLGGVRRYHAELGTMVEDIPITIPISLRKSDSDGGGNHFAGGSLAGPVAETDPAERIRSIGAQVTRWRQEPALAAPLAVMPLLARLPITTVAKAMGAKLAASDLQISNVPGMREPVYMAGAEVLRLFPFAPLPGCPAMITLVSHGETGCLGLNLDRAAVAEPERFMRCLREGFDEVFTLGAA